MTNGTKSDGLLLEEISQKLDILVGLMAVRGLEGDANAMALKLHGMGFSNRQIAPLVGLTEDAVKKRVQRSKKKKAVVKKNKKNVDAAA